MLLGSGQTYTQKLLKEVGTDVGTTSVSDGVDVGNSLGLAMLEVA
jgi:hypothetical protein